MADTETTSHFHGYSYSYAHEHGQGHGHDPHLAHHFEDMGQQRSSASLGMWTFLGTEVMFFGGLIVSYLVYRFSSPDVWAMASKYGLNVYLGTINTVVLLTSSLAMAMAVHSGEIGDRKLQLRYLLLTLGLGLLFMMIKGFEYKEEYDHGLIPGPGFSTHAIKLPDDSHTPVPSGAAGSAGKGESHQAAEASETVKSTSFLTVTPAQFVRQRAQMFFVFYFFMTGLHLLHMIVGVSLVTWVYLLARKGTFTPAYHTPLELTGLYWHFIDIVWVFLYPLLYLVDLHK